jgi:hypothetical protein
MLPEDIPYFPSVLPLNDSTQKLQEIYMNGFFLVSESYMLETLLLFEAG